MVPLSSMCFADEDLYRMTCPLICFYAVEYHLPQRVARQFGLRQEWPVPPFSTSVELHKIDRQKQKKTTDFETLHRDHIDKWDLLHDNVQENDEPHTNENFRAYLSWYLGVTRPRLKVQWTDADYADIESSEDEDTPYDLATREGTVVEVAPILDRVGNAIKQSVIERFPRTGVDETTLNTFLGRLGRRLRRAAARCGCRTTVAMDVHKPPARFSDTMCAGQSTSRSTRDTFEDTSGQDDEAEEIGSSQLTDAPSTQPTQPGPRRQRRPRDRYTPGTDALGGKGKTKSRRH
ncbi:unnamed protein product [Urochloa humidicola]